jgi:hypothetical protein
MSRNNFIAGLRDLADFLESNPDFYVPPKNKTITFLRGAKVPTSEIGDHAKMLGKCRKINKRNTIGLERKFGPITLKVEWWHYQVCTRVKTGTREVVDREYWKAPTITRTETEYKWVCPTSFVKACCEGES